MRRFCLFAAALVLAGCAGATSLPFPPATPEGAAKAGNKDTGTALISITIPTPAPEPKGARPAYVSPSTMGMTISLTGPSSPVKTIALRPQSRNCAGNEIGTTCTESMILAPCPLKVKCYRGSIATYDEVSCGQSACSIPAGAHQLSTNQDVAFSISARKRTRVPLALDGIPASVALVPLPPSTLSGNSSTGFTISKCVTAVQDVIVVGIDAGGNQIVGRGAPQTSLSSNDAVHLAVTPPQAATPNTFGLAPPPSLASATLPKPGSIVQLTARVTPLPQSGGSAQSLQVDVTFSRDLCGVITETAIPTAGSAPRSITTGPDGALWFTENGGNKIGRITTAGVMTETSIPTTFSAPVGIAAGPDGALWFAESCGNKIGRITTAGKITETSIRTLASGPSFITSGPDGALWFTQFNTDQIGRITTSGAITETAIPTIGSQPQGITTGPDGALWFAENFANQIGRITTGGTTIATLIPTLGNYPFGITSGPDGALWFTECNSNKIGRITTGGTITETATPTGESSPLGITTGPDGALWFAESAVSRIGRITTAGAITEIPIPTSNAVPYGVTSGPDGALWFTEAAVGKIGRLQ